MNIKGAIEWLEVEKQISYNDRTKRCTRELVELLKRGEKYEAMWNDLREGLEFKSNKDLLHMNYEDFVNYVKGVEQKYFPKEAVNETDNKGLKSNKDAKSIRKSKG